jgi:hypothetical protein
MPANALRVKERKFSTFEAVVDGQSVQIQGEYEVTVVNNGLLRVPSVSASVSELSLPNGSTTVIEDTEIKSIGTLGRGQTGKAKFEFTISGSSQELKQLAGSACQGSKSTLTTDETYSGLLLAIASTGEVEIKSPSPSCRRSGDLPDQPQPDPPQQPPQEPEPPEPPEQPPEEPEPPEQPPDQPEPPEEPEPTPTPPETQEVDIEGPTSPTVGEQATYSVSDPPNSASEYNWASSGDVFDESSPSDDNEYIVSYDSASRQRVEVDVRDNRGFQIGRGQINIDVQEQNGNGDTGDSGSGGDGQDAAPEEGGGNTVSRFDIRGLFVNGVPQTVQSGTSFDVEVENLDDGQGYTYDFEAVLSNDQGRNEVDNVYAQFIGPGETTEIEYIISPTELNDVQDGNYTLQIITERTFESGSAIIASTDVTVNSAGDGETQQFDSAYTIPSMSQAADNKEREY